MSLNETLKTLKSEFDSLEDDFSKYEYLSHRFGFGCGQQGIFCIWMLTVIP